MKKLLLFIILLTFYSFGQENRLVRQNDMRDTLTTNSRGFAKLASPTFTGTVTLPASINIGETALLPSVTELNYVDNVTSAIQTQLNAKLNTADALVIGDIDTVISGTATINLSLEPEPDSVVVTHGLGQTPNIYDIVITPQTDLMGFSWRIENVTSTTFEIQLGDTGFETITTNPLFTWWAIKRK
jgi:hypothetical protein